MGAKNSNALLLCIVEERGELTHAEVLLKELVELTKNVNLLVIESKVVFVRKKSAKFLLGTGKVQEISDFVKVNDISYIILDNELSPSQQRNWEKLTKKEILTRQEIIIDIFAKRAKTKEAVLQVELAKAKYEYPRLKRAWTHLSRQSGALFNRGDGESQIEIDRRLIKKKINDLEGDLKVVRKQRAIQRKKRMKRPIPTLSLIGYTNAGKSSLLNRMTMGNTYVDDKLFATLDPYSKKIILPNKQEVIMTDTVGFIRKLPHNLIDAFRSTLEEVGLGDILLHLIDLSDEDWSEHRKTTYEILEKISIANKAIITVFNKIDLIPEKEVKNIQKEFPLSVAISAKEDKNIDLLTKMIQEILMKELEELKFIIPASRYDIVSLIHQHGEILQDEFKDEVYYMTARVPKFTLGKLQGFVKEN